MTSEELTADPPRCPKCQSTVPFIKAGRSYCASTGKDRDGNCKKIKTDNTHQHLYCEWCSHEWVSRSVPVSE